MHRALGGNAGGFQLKEEVPMRALLFATTLALLAGQPAAAQTGNRFFGASASAGVDALGVRDGSAWTPGIVAQLGLYVRPTRGAWAGRVTGTFFNRQSARRAQMAGLAAELSYDLAGGRTRPYLVAGVGADWLYLSPVAPGSTIEHWSGAFIAGAGVQYRLGGLWWFAETRYHHFTKGTGWATHLVPVTVGVRF
jgi:opacity protein-like surface antigen